MNLQYLKKQIIPVKENEIISFYMIVIIMVIMKHSEAMAVLI